jgi:cysteinyl-tRNA synthetase
MKLKLYNTLTKKKEEFVPIKKNEVGVYGCGPTVYWTQHIGNLFRYVFEDYLVRVLKYDEYKIKHVVNVTDVGHLTSDADEGEDKMESAAKKEGRSAEEIANQYLEEFKNDLKEMNIIEPDVWPKATEHIKDQIDLIKTLEKKGFTYKTSDGIYFDTSKLKDYGKLGNTNTEKIVAGKRVSVGEKKNKTDFALWKFSDRPGIRQQEWKSPWGLGFPGWHIECSAMSSKYLGKHFDIHTGGEDHIQIHHANEIAQSEAAFGKKPWVNYWLHSRWLLFKGEKMSKSKGGLYLLSDLKEKGFSPLDYRYMCLTSHYRKQLNFSIELLEKSQTAYKRLKNKIQEIKNDKKTNKKYLEEFENAINDDLNIPQALQVLWKLVRDEKAEGKIKTIERMDEVFGLDLLKTQISKTPKEVQELIDERNEARKNKDWKKSDKLRDKISKLGYEVADTSEGTKITLR